MSSFGAAFYQAYAQGEAAKDATEQRARQAQDANAAAERLFHLTRGSEGSAFLPEYLRASEAAAGKRATGYSTALSDYYGTPADVVRRGAATTAASMPILQGGTKALQGLFTGAEEEKRLAAAQPAFAARTALADTTRSGIMQGILQRLNAIRTANAAKGYIGSGSASENLALRASIEGNQAAGAASATATLQNEQERQAIRNRIMDLQLQSPELAGALAAQYANLQLLPGQVTGAIQRSELAPYDYFRIGVGNPPPQVIPPWAQEQLSPWASVAAAGQGNLSALGRYYANRQLARQYGRPGAEADFNYQYGEGGSPYSGQEDFNYQYGEGGYPGYMAPDYGGYGTGAGNAAVPPVEDVGY